MRPATKRSARVETSLYELLSVAQDLAHDDLEASHLVQRLLDHSKVRLVRRSHSAANDNQPHRQAA
jgi:hypothetical protein